jgi:hypothetical protein
MEMISSVSGNQGEPMPGVGRQTRRAGEDNEKTLAELFSLVSQSGTGRFDVADFSAAAGLLSEPLLLPTAQNVRELSAELSAKLARIFARTGLSISNQIEFRVDRSTGSIGVGGCASDAQSIEEIVNNDPELKRLFQTINAISTHAYEIPQHLNFQREYLASNNPEQVVAKYASLFGPQSVHDFSMTFDGSIIRMLVDGRVWDPSARDSISG